MSIGCRIKTLRTQLGLSIDELAERLGKNRTTIYRYENGDIENLPLCILDSLAEALDTTPAYLMGWTDNKIYMRNSKTEIEHMEKWYSEFGNNLFTNEEHEKLIEYAKFLISQRG